MYLKDTTGRSMLVDLVHKPSALPQTLANKNGESGWLQAATFRLTGRSTIFAQMPYGEYGLRICSLDGAEVLLFEDGEKLVQTTVAARTQYITTDEQGRNLCFYAPGEKPAPLSSGGSAPVTQSALATTDDADSSGQLSVMFAPPAVPTGAGLVFAVVRFPKHNTPFGEPPQEEFPLALQMLSPADYNEHFAQNYRLVEAPSALPNSHDEFSREPGGSNSGQIICTFSGHNH